MLELTAQRGRRQTLYGYASKDLNDHHIHLLLPCIYFHANELSPRKLGGWLPCERAVSLGSCMRQARATTLTVTSTRHCSSARHDTLLKDFSFLLYGNLSFIIDRLLP